MTVKELMEKLEPLNPALDVRLVEVISEGSDDEEPEVYYPNITYVEYDKTALDHPAVLIY